MNAVVVVAICLTIWYFVSSKSDTDTDTQDTVSYMAMPGHVDRMEIQ